MSSFFTDPEASGPKATPRPPIWATGKQRPRLDPRAFLRVSLSSTRDWLAPRLRTGAARMDALSHRVAEGDFAPLAARLGRGARLVPGRLGSARMARGAADLLALAAATAEGPAPVAPLPFRGWNGTEIAPPPPVAIPVATPIATTHAPSPKPAATAERPRRPAPLPMPPREVPGADRDTLEAIRSVIHLSEVAPTRRAPRADRIAPPVPPRGAGALPELEPAPPELPGAVKRTAGQVLGYALIGLAMPVGLAHATFATLKGEDLRLRE